MYARIDGRLALFGRNADASFWEDGYKTTTDETLAHALRATKYLGAHRAFFKKWLPREGVILEAGSGNGLWVSRLRANGYQCYGFDFAVDTLIRSHHLRNDLPFVGGDVLHLPFGDNSLAAYLSFGVIEHLRQGPQSILAETRRVLKPGGVLCVSVPFDNRFRQRMPAQTEHDALARGLEFYQYFFTPDDLERELKLAGFRTTRVFHGYYVNLGLKGANQPWLNALLNNRYAVLIDLLPRLPRAAAHMFFTVAMRV